MLTSTKMQNPSWWDAETDSAWNRVKDALKRDWQQTAHDFGADVPDPHQSIGDTVRQAQGREPIPRPDENHYDETDSACRFGYGARIQFGDDYPAWDEDLEEFLREEWEQLPPAQRRTWMEDRAAIRYGWEFEA